MTVNEFKNLKKQMEEPESFRTFWRKTWLR
jgi:hypothetical protein